MNRSNFRTKRLRKNQSVKRASQGVRRSRRKDRRPHTHMLRWSLVCIILGGGLTWVYQKAKPIVSSWTTIQHITVMGLERVQRDEVLALLAIPEQTNLFSIQPDQFVERLKTHPWIATASLERIFPDTVSVTVNERRIAAIAESPRGPHFLDDQGFILPRQMPEPHAAIPVLTGLNMAALQEQSKDVQEHAKAGMHVAKLIAKQFKARPTVDVSNVDNIIADIPNLRFRFGMSPEDQWKRFQVLFPAIQQDMKGPGQIVDLRYSGKVILRRKG